MDFVLIEHFLSYFRKLIYFTKHIFLKTIVALKMFNVSSFSSAFFFKWKTLFFSLAYY